MSKVTYDNLLGGGLCPLLARDILVKIKDDYVPADFIILDIGADEDVPLILGRPFLYTKNAVIYVGSS